MSHSVRIIQRRLTISWAFVMWWHVLITETHNTKLEQWHPWFMEVSFGLVQGLKHFLSKDVQKHQWGNWMGNQLLDLEPLQKVSTVPLYSIYYTYNCSCSFGVLILVSFNQFLFLDFFLFYFSISFFQSVFVAPTILIYLRVLILSYLILLLLIFFVFLVFFKVLLIYN